MALDLLDTPLRISWELHTNGKPISAVLTDCVVERLLAAGVFFATLEQQPLLHPRISPVIERLVGGGCQTAVVCDGHPAELASLDGNLVIRHLFLNAAAWIDTDGLQRSELAKVVRTIRTRGYEPALLLVPKKENILLIPELFSFCQEHGVGRIKLPNSPLDGSVEGKFGFSFPGPEELGKLAAALDCISPEAAAGVALDVHDLFLWELLQPVFGGDRGEYGGCQAANSLGHIDGLGILHPCSSWLQPLGALADHSFEELWNSPLRYKIRDEIASTPQGCLGCGDYSVCLGGCRGLSRSLNLKAGGRDLLCRGPRPT